MDFFLFLRNSLFIYFFHYHGLVLFLHFFLHLFFFYFLFFSIFILLFPQFLRFFRLCNTTRDDSKPGMELNMIKDIMKKKSQTLFTFLL